MCRMRITPSASPQELFRSTALQHGMVCPFTRITTSRRRSLAFGVFIHRSDSIYEDSPAERYQFPNQYLARVEACVGDWIIYYEPRKRRSRADTLRLPESSKS